MRGVNVDHEMQIRRVREKTDRTFAQRCPCQVGQQGRERVAQRGDLSVVNGPPNGVGIADDIAPMHHGRLDSARETRKAVAPREAGLRLVLIEVDRERGAIEPCVRGIRLEPDEQLTLDDEWKPRVGGQLRHPRTGTEHQVVGGVRSTGCLDANFVVVRAPRPDRLVEAQRGAGRGCDAQMRRVASVGIEVAPAAVENRNFAGPEMKSREPRKNLVGRQNVVSDPELSRAAKRARYELSVARADHQAADLVQQRLTRPSLELAPEIVGAA